MPAEEPQGVCPPRPRLGLGHQELTAQPWLKSLAFTSMWGEAETQIPPQTRTPPLSHLDAVSIPFLTPQQKLSVLCSWERYPPWQAVSPGVTGLIHTAGWADRQTGKPFEKMPPICCSPLVSCLSHGWLS